MKKKLFILLIFCLTASFALAADGEPNPSSSRPDLLQSDLLDDGFMNDEDVFADDDFDLNGIYDPLEPMNRFFFEFNDRLYFWIFKPVKTGYSYIIPEELRECVGNFFNNLAAPIRFVNNLLQGRFEDAGVVFSRFLINSTIGVYGLADVALQEFNLEPRLADFGQTLGVYGLGEGVYICWPVLGPSNLRDTVGIVGDTFASPIYHVDMTISESVLYYAVNRVNFLSLTPEIYEDLKKYSLDPYVAMRQSFYDFRRNAIKRARSEETDF